MPEDLPCGQRGTGRLPHSAALRASNLQPFISSHRSQTRCVRLLQSGVGHEAVAARDLGTDPVNLAPVGQDCGRPPLTLRRPQTCCPTSALPRMLSHPAAPPALRCILRSLRLLRIARCPRRPTSGCCAASLLRNRRRSGPLPTAADIPFQGNPQPLRPRRRPLSCYALVCCN